MNSFPLVSIVTSVYNSVDTIEETILSVKNLNYKNIQYLIIDGGSTDGTLNIIENHLDFIDVFISEKDNGIYDAWNKGVINSKGEWILFLGADDKLKFDSIDKLLLPVIKSTIDSKYDYISGRSEIIHNNKLLKVTGEAWVWDKFRRYMCTAQCAALHNKELYSEIGLYDVSFKISGDYELLLRKKSGLRAAYVDEVVVEFKTGGVSNRNYSVLFETYRAINKNKSLTNIGSFLNLIKSFLIKVYRDRNQ
jgi:glycosyltransferase involved in cell wall biosynthesis